MNSHWCAWVYDDTHCTYETECGGAWSLIEGTLVENKVIYCPFCGGKIILTSEEGEP